MPKDPLPVLRLVNVCRAYANEYYCVLALHGVNIDIKKGEFVAVMGPSGCGKTTLLNILGMLDTISYGSIEIDGNKVTDISDEERSYLRSSSIGMIFQSFNLIDELTALENVELPFLYSPDYCEDSPERAKKALAQVGLADRITHMPAQLSGGEMQRVAIARAIVMEPDIILADEPTGNLDSTSGQVVMNIVADLHKGGTTIVLVTHDEKIAEMAERIIRIDNGRVVRP